MIRKLVIITAAVTWCIAPLKADTVLLNEITSLESELQRINTERERNHLELQREQKEFGEYAKRVEQRKTSYNDAIDSLREQTHITAGKRDSLLSAVTGIETAIRQQELLQNSIRRQLIASCSGLLKIIEELPPAVRGQTNNTLQHLRSELESGRVGNAEAFQRYVSIVARAEDHSFEIDVSEADSPIQQIRGTVHRIRIGNFFEAVADPKGQRIALWTGYDNKGEVQWLISDDPDMAAGIIEAVKIRMGQAVPSFVEIPFGTEEKE